MGRLTCFTACAVAFASAASVRAEEMTPRESVLEDSLDFRPSRERSFERTPEARRLELGYKYNLAYPRYLDRQAVATVAVGAMDMVHGGMETSLSDDPVVRTIQFLAVGLVDRAILKCGHEYGHLSSFTKCECNDFKLRFQGDAAGEWTKASVADLFSDVFGSSDALVSVDGADWNSASAKVARGSNEHRRMMVSVEAGGLNQEQVVLNRYADKVHAGRFGVLDTLPCYLEIFSTVLYPAEGSESDLADYVSGLGGMGIESSSNEIKLLSMARLFSGSSIVAARGFAAGYLGRPAAFQPITVARLENVEAYWPEFQSYLSQFGPTLKACVPMRRMGDTLVPSYERVWADGASVDEVGMVVRKALSERWSLEGQAFGCSAGGRWMEAGVGFKAAGWLTIGVDYFRGTGYSIHRDVFGATQDFLEDAESGVKLGFAASLAM